MGHGKTNLCGVITGKNEVNLFCSLGDKINYKFVNLQCVVKT